MLFDHLLLALLVVIGPLLHCVAARLGRCSKRLLLLDRVLGILQNFSCFLIFFKIHLVLLQVRQGVHFSHILFGSGVSNSIAMAEGRLAIVGCCRLVSPVGYGVVPGPILAICKHVLLIVIRGRRVSPPHVGARVLFFLQAALLLDHLLVSGVALFQPLRISQCVQCVV